MSKMAPSVDAVQMLESRLDRFFGDINAIILSRQDPITGLFPASTDVNHHGNYQDAWVRDNVYSVLAVWGLAMAYRRADINSERAYLLEQSVVKLMRGLLFAMMRQAEKVERFKHHQDPLDSLHAKYGTCDGDTVVDDDKWGHLQFDATAIFLIALVRMTASGLRIVFTLDEVNFVQNLVHYIGPAYRTPDYGIWERGNKINNGRREINASSVGMVKAALTELDGFNLLGADGDQAGVIHVMEDEIARARTTLESLLPCESRSKAVDAALLSIIGFPAFAVEDDQLVDRTRREIQEKLEGRYGLKRFLLDGHQTVLEQVERLHYEPEELQNFAAIESEWPLFFCYLYISALLNDDVEQADIYRDKLHAVMIEKDGRRLLPELYFVPAEHIAAEKEQPGSQRRQANNNLPLIWAQSLYFLGAMLEEKLILANDLDPLRRRLRVGRKQNTPVAFTVIAEDKTVQDFLAAQGIASQTQQELSGVNVLRTSRLTQVFTVIGQNEKLGLSGRPIRSLRSLATSKRYRLNGQSCLFLPQYQYQENFYLGLDNHLLAERLRTEAAYLQRHWHYPGLPLVTLYVDNNMLQARDLSYLLAFLQELALPGAEARGAFLSKATDILERVGQERIDNVHGCSLSDDDLTVGFHGQNYLDFDVEATVPLDEGAFEQQVFAMSDQELLTRLQRSRNLCEQAGILQKMIERNGIEYVCDLDGRSLSLVNLLGEVLARASSMRLWPTVRLATGLLGRFHFELTAALTEVLALQKKLVLGRGYSGYYVIEEPVPAEELQALIERYSGQDPQEVVLVQEVLVFLAMLSRAEPALLKGVVALRIGDLINLAANAIAAEQSLTQDRAFDALVQLSPFDVQQLVRRVLIANPRQHQDSHAVTPLSGHPLAQAARVTRQAQPLSGLPSMLPPGVENWLDWRVNAGVVLRLPDNFQQAMWQVLKHSHGIIIGDPYHGGNRIDSERGCASMTEGERSLEYFVEHLLQEIQVPEYRMLYLEALQAIFAFFEYCAERQPAFVWDDYLVLDVIIQQAVRLHWLDHYPAHQPVYEDHSANALELFYRTSPAKVAERLGEALELLINERSGCPA